MLKTHLLTGYVSASGAHKTFCGKMGWEETGDEFTDDKCDRFEAVTDRKKATCGNCLRAASR